MLADGNKALSSGEESAAVAPRVCIVTSIASKHGVKTEAWVALWSALNHGNTGVNIKPNLLNFFPGGVLTKWISSLCAMCYSNFHLFPTLFFAFSPQIYVASESLGLTEVKIHRQGLERFLMMNLISRLIIRLWAIIILFQIGRTPGRVHNITDLKGGDIWSLPKDIVML